MNGKPFDPASFFKTPAPGPVAPAAVAPAVVATTPGPLASPGPIAPAAPAPGPVASPGPAVEAVSEVGVIDFGKKLNRYPIERFRGVKGFNRRISVLTTKRIYGIKTHYEPGVGYFYCFGGTCCDLSDPAVRYLFPVVVYDTDREGNPISAKFEIQYVAISDTVYDSWMLMNKTAPLDTIDIVASCTDEQYQKMTWIPAGPALWRQNEAFCNQVWAQYQLLEKHIIRTHARKFGHNQVEAEATYRKIKGDQPAADNPGAVAFDLSKFTNT